MGMIKIADADMASFAEELASLKASKKGIEERISKVESALKEGMEERSATEAVFGSSRVSIVKVAETRTVDTAKLKADGLYDRYSKPKAGYTQVKVSLAAGVL